MVIKTIKVIVIVLTVAALIVDNTGIATFATTPVVLLCRV